jgi:hypothetical protein
MKPATTRYNRRMAIARPEGETIVRFSRSWRYVRAVCWAVVAVFLLFATLGFAVQPSDWKTEVGAGLGCLASGLFAGFIAYWLFRRARVYAGARVAVGPGGVRMQLVNYDGSVAWGEGEVAFRWEDIGEVRLENMDCKFTARGHSYTLTRKNCPSPVTVARLLMKGGA